MSSAQDHYPPQHDPYSSQTHLAEQAQYPPAQGGVHWGNSAASVAQRYLPHNSPYSNTPSTEKTSTGAFQKLDEERPTHASRLSSYDFISMGEQYDTRNSKEAHLMFAEGDFVKSRAGRIYAYLLNMSIITRWILYITPMAALLWIPGTLGLTATPNANIWHVPLLFWSIWLSVVWVGWWGALAFGMILPKLLKWTIGVAAVSTRHYIDWFYALTRYIAFYGWSLAIWISFQPLISTRISSEDAAKFPGSVHILGQILKVLFGIMLCAAVLLAEKFSIQFIAYKFHQRSYADRIKEQQMHMKVLVTLYSHSSDIPGRTDTLKDGPVHTRGGSVNPKKIFKSVLKGVRDVAEGATTALGNVASEITGTSTLQPSSPEAKVYTALASANKTRLLARRLFYSFRQEGASELVMGDIGRFFQSIEQAHVAFSIFDKDDNGDATREEVETACLDVHRELLSLSASMKDIDSAVGRLDNILMSLYVVIAALIMAVSVDASFTNLLTGAGSLILGLSWLIGGSAAEVLSSIIFLFIKHPYDIGDSVTIDKNNYTVQEIRLLSTIFVDSGGAFTQAPHSSLSSLFIRNHRRSGPESESFTMEVSYDTTFEKIEDLRARMIAFLQARRRDFAPIFDVVVEDIPGQEKMVLKASIKYKSNGHMGALRAKRRNMWMCALKNAMADVGIYGPAGNPKKPDAGPQQVTLVPWEEANPDLHPPKTETETTKEPRIPRTDYNFSDKNAVFKGDADDIFGEGSEINLTNPKQSALRGTVLPGGQARSTPRGNTTPAEEFEMRPGVSGGGGR